jgi:alpha-beta hydrolase superfamily lysophospholipase
MRKIIFTFALLIAAHCGASAQSEQDAQKVYDWFIAGQGDSIYAAFDENMQSQLPAASVSGLYGQLQTQVGKVSSAGEWQTSEEQGKKLFFRDVQFEQMALRFLVVYDESGKICGLRLLPVPSGDGDASSVHHGDGHGDRPLLFSKTLTVGADGYKLPAVLTIPEKAGAGKLPCVILVHGSGPHDRDETLGPNKPFLDLAEGLYARGIATLRYDKRTLVYREGYVTKGRHADYDTETVDDAVAAVRAVCMMDSIDPQRVFVLGHSLGGCLAPRIAQRAGCLAGVIILAGETRKMKEMVKEQMDYIKTCMDSASYRAAAAGIGMAMKGLPKSYIDFDECYSPVATAARLSTPMLIMQGERDYQVTMNDFMRWRSSLACRKNVSFKSYPALNHLFMEGKGKSTPSEYASPKHIPGYVINDIADFVLHRQ